MKDLNIFFHCKETLQCISCNRYVTVTEVLWSFMAQLQQLPPPSLLQQPAQNSFCRCCCVTSPGFPVNPLRAVPASQAWGKKTLVLAMHTHPCECRSQAYCSKELCLQTFSLYEFVILMMCSADIDYLGFSGFSEKSTNTSSICAWAG